MARERDVSDEAEEARQAVRRRPDEPAGWFRLCCLLLECCDPQAAAVGARLERFGDYAPGWCELGGVLFRAGRIEAARVAFARAASADAGLAAAQAGLGACLRQLGDPGAVPALRRAVALDPGRAECWFALGALCTDAGDRTGAVACYRAALRASPGLHEAAFNLGVALLDGGEVEAGLDAFACAWRTRPDALGRIAQALVSGPSGCLWLDPDGLRRALAVRTVVAV